MIYSAISAIILANEFYYPNVTRGHCGGLVKAEAFNETTANTFPTELTPELRDSPVSTAKFLSKSELRTSQLPWKLDQTQSLDLSKNFDNEILRPRSNPSIRIIRSQPTVKTCIRNFFKLENLKLQFYTYKTVGLFPSNLTKLQHVSQCWFIFPRIQKLIKSSLANSENV